mmetsp:Transcript_24300/g.65702  ORF Transcript_24300/g.65702 Transcript_24300/m.65702 type:complete len:117 (+) Transcript_24300:1138-1488(+)
MLAANVDSKATAAAGGEERYFQENRNGRRRDSVPLHPRAHNCTYFRLPFSKYEGCDQDPACCPKALDTIIQDLPFVDVHGNEEIRKIRAFAVQCMHGATGGRGRGGGGGGAGARGG